MGCCPVKFSCLLSFSLFCALVFYYPILVTINTTLGVQRIPVNVLIDSVSKLSYNKTKILGGRCTESRGRGCFENETLPAESHKCKEMFSVIEPRHNFANSSRIKSIIETIHKNYENQFGGDTDPYQLLSEFLPSLLKKSSRGKKQHALNTTQSELSEKYPFDIVTNMVQNQGSFTYKLLSETETRLSLSNGVLPHIPCKLKTDYSTIEITQCLNETLNRNNGIFHIAFLGDSKLRDLFVSLLIATRDLNYTIQQQVRRSLLIINK